MIIELKKKGITVILDRKPKTVPMYGIYGIRRESFARTKCFFLHFGAFVLAIFRPVVRS